MIPRSSLALTLTFLVAACGGGMGASPQAGAQSPVSLAGTDQSVAAGALVTLDGSASTDPGGLPLTYAWSQAAGPAVTLSSPSVARPTFTAPAVPAGQAPATLVFSLTVSSAAGASGPASVSVTVSPQGAANPAPIASAGPGQAVASGAAVTLDGSASSDPDGQAISFAWTQISGPAVALSDAAAARPGFVAPVVDAGAPPVTLIFSLVVSDASSSSAPASVTVTVNPAGTSNPPPPGTPPPATSTSPLPSGGSGSNRWQIGAPQGLYVVDPALVSTTAGTRQEPTVQGLVNVTFGTVSSGSFIPPPDTVVTLNGVPLLRDPTMNGAYFRVDETRPLAEQPHPGSGGEIVLVATATVNGQVLQRTLVLPCPSDIDVTTTPAIGSALVPAPAPATPLRITSASDIDLNFGLPIAAILPPPAAMLWGYDPATRTLLASGGPRLIGAGPLDVSLGVDATSAPAYLADLRWPGHWVIDGETGGFCGLVKRWTYTK